MGVWWLTSVSKMPPSDPANDGFNKGKPFPEGPWRVSDQASFGSVTMGNGDPSTPDGFSATAIDRITVDEVFSENNTYNILPAIVSMPVSAKLALSLLESVIKTSGKNATEVFDTSGTSGGLSTTYCVGPSDVVINIENKNKYSLKKVWNLLITIKGSREGDRYVIVGSQRDSLNAGAASPGSGNAVFIEMLRAVGDLLTNGWVPHRTLLFASFGGEQFGSVGSSEWIDRHFSHLGGRGIVYLNLRDVVRGAGPLDCEAAASLRKNIYLMSAQVQQPKAEVAVDKFFTTVASSTKRGLLETTVDTSLAATTTMDANASADDDDEPNIAMLPLNTTFKREDLPDEGNSVFSAWLLATKKKSPAAKLPKINLPGSGNRISPFLARLGIPSMELSFDGDYYGVENSGNDTIEWMKKYADPGFTFHRAAAQLYGSIMLSFSDAIFLQYDFTEVARDLRYGEAYLMDAVAKSGLVGSLPLSRLGSSIATFETAAVAVTKEIRDMSDHMVNLINGELIVDLKRVREMNTRLLMTEKAFLLPAGLPHMPWLKHVRILSALSKNWEIGSQHCQLTFFCLVVYVAVVVRHLRVGRLPRRVLPGCDAGAQARQHDHDQARAHPPVPDDRAGRRHALHHGAVRKRNRATDDDWLDRRAREKSLELPATIFIIISCIYSNSNTHSSYL